MLHENKERLGLRHAVHHYGSVEEVLAVLAEESGLPVDEIKKRSRNGQASELRKKFVYICCRVLGFSGEEVARCLQVSGPAVSWTLSKAEGLMRKRDINKFISLSPG